MDILVWILAVASYLYDLVKDFFGAILSPFVCGIIYLSIALAIFQKHLDQRLDAIERRLMDLQRPDYE